jgi:fluoride exporter
MSKVLVLSIGGIAGTLARYFLANSVYRYCGTAFPYGTMVVNATGCFLIGFFGTLAENKISFGPNLRLLLMVGFCGAFTTFSTYIFETNGLVRDGEMVKAALNVIISVLLGFFVFKIGMILGKLF